MVNIECLAPGLGGHFSREATGNGWPSSRINSSNRRAGSIVNLGDQHLEERTVLLAQGMVANKMACIPKACGGRVNTHLRR